jgi:hypothetical protein
MHARFSTVSILTTTTLVVLSVLSQASLQAQGNATDPSGVSPVELVFAIEGPSPPVLPQTIARDDEGGITTRAVRLDTALRLDGRLDEPLYETVMPISDFIQNEPVNDTPASERTEVWISFDDDKVYVSLRAYESQPDRMIANEMRRDSNTLLQNENFAFQFDTFFDGRSSVVFQFNPIGGRWDGQAASEGSLNSDWNPVWELAVGRFDGGWTAEAAVPFKSLNYGPGRSQLWGFNARRINRWKNEVSYLTRMPTGTGIIGIAYASYAAPLVGIEAPPSSRTVDVKPYVISDLTSDVPSDISNEFNGDIGLDARVSVTQSLSADFTYNTDFAQVEADEQQVNLTRFSLFFPEKREFFLENAGLFNFGGAGGFGRGNATPTLFYSRRIGLEGGREVPILAGGRLTGRMGAFNVGVINIQTKANANRDLPATNFSVARVRRDILRRSSIGAILTNRSDTPGSLGSAQAYGVDASFAFYENLEFQTYIAQTKNPGRDGEDTSYRTRMEYDGDLYGVTIDHLGVGANFNPAVGFARRTDIRRTFGQLRYSPRPNSIDAIRQFTFQLQGQYIENSAGQIETRQAQAQFQVQFESSDRIQVQYTPGYELLPFDFNLSTGVRVPAGGYSTDTARASFTVGQQRFASGTWAISRSEFYGGHRWSYGYTGARVKLHPQLAVEPGISVNQVTTPFGDFTTELYSSRVTYTATPLMFVSGLVQYNSARDSVSTNVRLRWEYQPGSELFVVYNEGRDTTTSGLPDLQNRSLIVKVNRLFRF